MRLCAAISVIGVVAFTMGCQKTSTITTPDGREITVTSDGTQMTIEGPDGEEFRFAADESGLSLPADFPDDIPVYPGSVVIMSSMGNGQCYATLETNDGFDAVCAYYVENLESQGWTDPTDTRLTGATILSATKGERQLNVTASAEPDGKTMISLSLTSPA